MHKGSQIISKTKPKIRIIHIFAPEIIKTDVENFRELVQKLTGKPSGDQKYCKKKPRIAGTGGNEQESSGDISNLSENPRMIAKKNGGFWGLDQTRERVKEEARVCCDEISGGYLGGFSDLEGFISDLGEFPLIPFDGTQIMQGFEQPQLL